MHNGKSFVNIIFDRIMYCRQCEVDMLDKEAKEMERNLKNLQARMQQQSIEDEAVPKFGGSRWKSARPEKGTVKSYAKDIQDKHRQKSSAEIPSHGSQSAPQLATQKEVHPSDFRGRGRLIFVLCKTLIRINLLEECLMMPFLS